MIYCDRLFGRVIVGVGCGCSRIIGTAISLYHSCLIYLYSYFLFLVCRYRHLCAHLCAHLFIYCLCNLWVVSLYLALSNRHTCSAHIHPRSLA